MRKLCRFLDGERRDWPVFPIRKDETFSAFRRTAFEDVKVVVLGQDPYHDARAMGLAFSVRPGATPPRSLKNIQSAIRADLPDASLISGDLSCWADQGVLLLNSVLTVGEVAGSHRGGGWEDFTDRATSLLSNDRRGLVFLLWGKEAQKKADRIVTPRHHVLYAVHPRVSTFASSCDHFSQANSLLGSSGIQWDC